MRTRLIELFELFDPADPDVIAGRRNLTNALYWGLAERVDVSRRVRARAPNSAAAPAVLTRAGRARARRMPAPPEVADARTVVDGRVTVEHLAPGAGPRQSQPVAAVLVAGEVEHAGHYRSVGAVAQEAQHVAWSESFASIQE